MEKKRSPLKMIVSGTVLVLLAALTYWMIFRENDPALILRALGTVDKRWIAGGLLLSAGYLVFQAAALAMPLRRLGVRRSAARCLGYIGIGFYFSAITPSSTGGQPMQLYYMCRDGVPVSAASLALLLVNIAYQIVVMVLGAVMLALRHGFIAGAMPGMTALIIYGYAVTGLLLAALCLAMFSRRFLSAAARRVIGLLAKIRLVKDAGKTWRKAQEQLAAYAEGARIIRRDPGMFAGVMGLTVLQQACYFLIPYAIYRSFGLTQYGPMDLLAVQAILHIAVAYLPLPGAVGASEKGFVSLFAIFFLAGQAVPAMLLSRAVSFYLPLIVCGILTAVLQLRKRRVRPPGKPAEKTGVRVGAA